VVVGVIVGAGERKCEEKQKWWCARSGRGVGRVGII